MKIKLNYQNKIFNYYNKIFNNKKIYKIVINNNKNNTKIVFKKNRYYNNSYKINCNKFMKFKINLKIYNKKILKCNIF